MKYDNLGEQLLSIQIKPYEPLHSAKCLKETWKVRNENFLKKAPKQGLFSRATTATGRTSSTLSSIKSNKQRAATALSRNSRNSNDYKSNSQLSSRSLSNYKQGSRPSSTTSSIAASSVNADDKSSEKGIPFEKRDDGDCSVASSNISLVSVDSASTEDLNLNRTYGLFNYKSYFEQYMNGRSKFKIIKSNMPKSAPDADTEYFLYDLIENYETSKLLDIYNCYYIQLNQKRAKSVNSFHPRGYDEVLKKNGKDEPMKKAISIECLDAQYLEKKWNISKRIDESEEKRKKLEYDLKQRREFLTMEYTDSLYPTFWARDLKQPSLFEIGSRQLRKFDALEEKYHAKKEEKLKVAQDPYEHIQSKLSAYLSEFKKNKVQHNNPKRAYTAIGVYKRGSSSFAHVNTPLVKGSDQTKSNVPPLRMNNSLNKLMREDLRMNKGPIYFAELTEENLKASHGKVPLKEKYLTLFEWLLGVKEEECRHFFHNPFVNETSTNTEITNENPESTKLANPSEDVLLAETINDWKMNVLKSSKYKVDPFVNPKFDLRVRTELPKRVLTNAGGHDKLIDIKNRRILSVTKDFTTMLNLKEKHLKGSENYQSTKKDIYGRYLTTNDFLSSRDKLKKKIAMNDLIKTRMTLDLFAL